MIYDFELGFNYIIYNEFKIFNIKIILYVLQMIEKFEVLKIKKKLILFYCFIRVGLFDLVVFFQIDIYIIFGCGQLLFGRLCFDF